jgi:D-cysteine desulfhydrase/L-cysteate sulfo-lyase
VCGIAVSGGEPEKIERAKRIANEAAARLGLRERLELADLITDQSQIGEGYGIPTEAALEAIRLLATTEAILLDPCYTSKAMAGMIHDIRSGEVTPSETVVFLHTGGMPAVFTQSFVERLKRDQGS